MTYLRRPTLPALVLSLLLAACGGGGLEEASEELAQIQTEIEQAREVLTEREQRANEAEQALEQARADLAEAEKRLAEAKQNVAEQASDAVLFREVQGQLLDDRDLEGVAISARVAQRVVTLEGSVSSQEQKRRAEEIAQGVVGVATVVNQIDIDVATPPQ